MSYKVLNRCWDKSDDAFAEVFYRCSYLTKVRGKGCGGLGANNYSGSRVRSKANSVMVDENAKVGQQTRPLERIITDTFMALELKK
jgi:hypothetical protein